MSYRRIISYLFERDLGKDEMNIQEYTHKRLMVMGMNQTQLANLMGVSKVFVCDFLKGRESLSLGRYKQLFGIIGTPEALTERTK